MSIQTRFRSVYNQQNRVGNMKRHIRALKFAHTIRTFLCALALGISGRVSVFAVSGPPPRTGLWMTQPIEAGDNLGAFEAQVRANPHLSGVCLHAGWKDIEKEPGKPDFSAIDK